MRHFGFVGKLVALVITLGFLVFIFGGAGYLASRQLYFLGTDRQGTVTVYRGFPYQFFGVNFYETYYVSGVPASLIPPDRRSTVLDEPLPARRRPLFQHPGERVGATRAPRARFV